MTIITPYRISVTEAVLADLTKGKTSQQLARAECLLDSQVRIDQEFLARRSTAISRDEAGIECLKQRDGAGVVAGEGRPDFTGNPRFQPRLDLRTHLGQEVKEQPAADTPRHAGATR